MKKIIFALIFLLLVVGGIFIANRAMKKETPEKIIPKPLSAAEREAARKQWEATPAGKMHKEWEESVAGKKVFASEAKIYKSIRAYTYMEGMVTSLSLPPGSRLGFGIMVRINGDDYILSFGPVKSDKKNLNATNELAQLQSLKVNDKIRIKSHNVSHAPKYTYPIIAGDHIERDGKIIYQRAPRAGGC